MDLFDRRTAPPPGLPVAQLSVEAAEVEAGCIIDEALTAMRLHFGMPVAYLSEFVGDELVFRAVSAPGLEDLIKPGDVWPLSSVYCPRVLSGELPNLIPDTSELPACQSIEVTHTVPIRSHISLPVRRADGSAFGMFCCLSTEPNPSLNERDLSVMSTFANLVARQVRQNESEQQTDNMRRAAVRAAIDDSAFDIVFQPLVSLADGRTFAVEALSRFQANPYRTPDLWFDDALQVGLGLDLEEVTLRRAFAALPDLPPGLLLSFNCSPDLICDGRLAHIIPKGLEPSLILEVSEAQEVVDWSCFSAEVARLSAMGVKIAVDDVGAGYSGLQRLAQVRADLLKVDRALASGIDQSLTQRAAVASLVYFAAETGAQVLVEGIERREELDTLRELGVDHGQGWIFGKPKSLAGLRCDGVLSAR